MALQPISNLGTAAPLSGTAQPNNFGAPDNWVPGNGPPPGMTWSETQGQWMPSDSVVGAMPGPNIGNVIQPGAIGVDPTYFDKFGNRMQNDNPYGFTAPTGPAASVMVPYYNKVTGQTWSAPSGGYTPPSADWLQGSPANSQITPMPGFAPGMDPVKPTISAGMAFPGLPQAEQDRLNALNQQYMNRQFKFLPESEELPQRAPPGIAYEDPEFFRRAMERMNQDNMVQQPDPGPFVPAGRAPTNNIIKETLVPDGKGGFYDTASPRAPTGSNQNVGILSPAIGQQPRPMNNPAPMPQQPAPTPGGGGLGSLLTPQRPVQTPPVNAGGLNSLIRPQTPVNTGFLGSTQPVTRNQVAPRAGSLPSLRIRPTFQRSLSVPFAKPPFRR